LNLSLSPSEFQAVIKKTKSLKVGDLLFKYCSWPTPSLGLIVSKKYGNAINRNLFKRRCRELFKKNCINNNSYVAVIVKPNRTNINYKELCNAFNELLMHIK